MKLYGNFILENHKLKDDLGVKLSSIERQLSRG